MVDSIICIFRHEDSGAVAFLSPFSFEELSKMDWCSERKETSDPGKLRCGGRGRVGSIVNAIF